MSKKIVTILIFVCLLLETPVASSTEPPFNAPQFRNIINQSRLQFCDSQITPKQYSKHRKSFASEYFYLSNKQYLTLEINKKKCIDEIKRYCEDDKRVDCPKKMRLELMQSEKSNKHLWKTSSQNPKRLISEVRLSKPALVNEYTWIQIHDWARKDKSGKPNCKDPKDDCNKPLLRLFWKEYHKGRHNHIWAVLRKNTKKSPKIYQWFDLGVTPSDFFKTEVSVQSNTLSIMINGRELVNEDISYWSERPNYFKSGLYLSNRADYVNGVNPDGRVKIEFKTLHYQ